MLKLQGRDATKHLSVARSSFAATTTAFSAPSFPFANACRSRLQRASINVDRKSASNLSQHTADAFSRVSQSARCWNDARLVQSYTRIAAAAPSHCGMGSEGQRVGAGTERKEALVSWSLCGCRAERRARHARTLAAAESRKISLPPLSIRYSSTCEEISGGVFPLVVAATAFHAACGFGSEGLRRSTRELRRTTVFP